MNELIRFTKNGDTIKMGSLYYKIHSPADTILKGEKYHFKVTLDGYLYKDAFICLCDFDEKYRQKPGGSCDTFEMNNRQISLSPKSYTEGENVIRGVIVNYENYTIDNGEKANRQVDVFFTDKFYVKPSRK